MCGICGIYKFNQERVPAKEIETMMKIMIHRGPDDQATFLQNNYALGHIRLSIIDLSKDGKQPFISEDGKYVLVFNGEIYNYIELRRELKADFNFKTNTDTEVLLKAFIKWKEGCLHKLNGMFSFVIINTETGDLFAARDRFGIKPFYYTLDQNQFSFASEIKPLLKNAADREVNNQIIYDYLVFNRVQHDSQTFFNSIKKLQHGHLLKIERNEVSIKRWYDLKTQIKEPYKSSEEFKEGLIEATTLRLRSDVPVGAMLSGGLDSSSIVSIVLKYGGIQDLNTFSAVYEKGMRQDESEYISEYSSAVKHMHYTYPKGQDLYEDLSSFVNCLEEPVPGLSVYAEYKLMALCQKHVTVVLNGQGADEYLGGYHYFFGYKFLNLLEKGKLFSLGRELTSYMQKFRSIYGLKALAYFMMPSGIRQKLTAQHCDYINKDFAAMQGNKQSFDDLYNSKSLKEAFINHFEYKFEHMLLWGDKTSMHHSLELRFPFLDHNLIERSIGLKDDQILKNGETKRILRGAMKNILPEKIRKRQDKIGFEVPYSNWLNEKKFKELTFELLQSDSFKNRDFINEKEVAKLIVNPQRNAKEIWKLLNLELWFRNMVEI